MDEPSGISVRVVEYEVTNREGSDEIFYLITTIADPDEASGPELAAAYAERWEFKSSPDELKTHQRGRGEVLRSKSPEMVKQEIWAMLLTHYAIRHLMREAADQADVDPDRLSFMRSLRVIRRQVTSQAGFSPSRLTTALEVTRKEISARLNPPQTPSQQPSGCQTGSCSRIQGEARF